MVYSRYASCAVDQYAAPWEVLLDDIEEALEEGADLFLLAV